jgi:hypothetical protein
MQTRKKDTQLCWLDESSMEWHQLELLAKADGHASLKSAANEGALWGFTLDQLTRLWAFPNNSH